MANRRWIVGATLSALLACTLAGAVFHPSFGRALDQGIRAAGATTGVHPVDLVRLLTALMLVHYALALPRLLKKARRAMAHQQGVLSRAMCASHFTAHVALQVAVPSLFCVMVENGRQLIEQGVSLTA